jgi:hypothetical protein
MNTELQKLVSSLGARLIWLTAFVCIAPLAMAKDSSPCYQTSVKEYLGITRDVDIAGDKGFFDQWMGCVEGKLYGVFAGYELSNPMIGVLRVSDPPTAFGELYPLPHNDGPIEFVSEANGVLRLQTKIGTFEKYGDEFGNGHGFVTVDHVTTYYFDLRSRKFVGP